ncbi:MAG TPA: flagellar FlbD family protein [Firmicutes bacterium]|nr:flagellar FlbD family protein [Bacillota bacterium]
MIQATRLDGSEIVINADLIETVEAVPDTVITLTTGRKLVVRESVDELVGRVVAYRRRVYCRRRRGVTGGPPGRDGGNR